MITIYKNTKYKKGKDITIDVWLSLIKKSRFSSLISKIRKDTSTKYYSNTKRYELPCANLCGSFNIRLLSGINSFSDHLYFDVDDVNQDTKEKIKNLNFVKSVWNSCSNKGLGILVKSKGLNKDNFASTYKYLFDRFKENNITVDYLADYTRLNILSYDPDIYINNESRVILPVNPEIKIKENIKIDEKRSIYDIVGSAIGNAKKKVGPYINGNRHYFIVHVASVCLLCKVDKERLKNIMYEMGYEPTKDINKIIDNCYSSFKNQN